MTPAPHDQLALMLGQVAADTYLDARPSVTHRLVARVSGRYWYHQRPQPAAEPTIDPTFQRALLDRLADITGRGRRALTAVASTADAPRRRSAPVAAEAPP